MKIVSSSSRSCRSPTAMVEGPREEVVVAGEVAEAYGAAGSPRPGTGPQCPDLRQRRHRTGSRQEAALWSLAKHLKQRPSVAWRKARRAAVGGRL